jgi:hypothetical protein
VIVRLTTLLQKRKQSLLFGCVELFPHEVPLPPDALKPEPSRVRDATVLTTVSVMAWAPTKHRMDWQSDSDIYSLSMNLT